MAARKKHGSRSSNRVCPFCSGFGIGPISQGNVDAPDAADIDSLVKAR